ncbi:hypothetical protein EDC04DRAFT_946374 [Pisolithus marmoratus]|nr:hypothetical protein EDC04DRAFT_946374 [Pisolithus marmoratus]
MHSETSTLPLLDYAPPGISTVQQYQTLASHCHLDHNSAAGPGSASIDVLEPQRLTSPTGDVCHVPISELPGCSSILAPLPVQNPGLVGHLNREQDVALPLGCVTSENRASSVACGYWYWDTQGHTSDQLTNYNISFPSPYATSLQQYCAIGQPLTYPGDYRKISTFGDLSHGPAGPTVGLGSVPPFHGYTSGQMIDSSAVWSELSSSPLPSLQEPHLSDDVVSGNVSLSAEQIQTEMVTPTQFPSSFTMQLMKQTHFSTPFPYTCPVPSQSNSTPHPPPEHLGYLPDHTMPAGLPDFHGFHAGNKVDLHTAGAIDNHTSHTLSDHPLPTFSNHGEQLFDNHVTYILGDHIAGITVVGVDDHRNADKSQSNAEQVVCSHPRSSLPSNQFALSSRELRIAGGDISGPFHHVRHFSTLLSQTTTRLPKARSARNRNMYYQCGWRDDDGKICDMPIKYDDCANHFAATHDIKNMARNVEVVCRWCSSKAQKKVKRKCLLRHLREVHLHYLRSEKKTSKDGLYAGAIDKAVFLT